MTDPRHRCVSCHRYDHVCGKLSSRGLCFDCRMRASLSVQRALREHTGPEYEHWKQRSEQGMINYMIRLAEARAAGVPAGEVRKAARRKRRDTPETR